MRKTFKAIIELISAALSMFAIHRELIAGLGKLSPKQQAVLDRAKGPLAKCKAEFKEGVKDVFGTIARVGRSEK